MRHGVVRVTLLFLPHRAGTRPCPNPDSTRPATRATTIIMLFVVPRRDRISCRFLLTLLLKLNDVASALTTNDTQRHTGTQSNTQTAHRQDRETRRQREAEAQQRQIWTHTDRQTTKTERVVVDSLSLYESIRAHTLLHATGGQLYC